MLRMYCLPPLLQWLLVAGLPGMLAAGVLYQDPDFTVSIESGIVYGTGATQNGTSTKSLQLDRYAPVGNTHTNRPSLLLVHGGSFSGGTRTSPDMVAMALYFAARGWVCFSISYRLEGDAPPAPFWVTLLGDPTANAAHAAAVDTKKAVRWIRSRHATYGIDPNRITGLGHSAGAFAVLMAAVTDPEDFANDAGTPIPDSDAGISSALDLCVDVSGDLALWDTDVDAGDAPLMIWHGTADTVVPFASAEHARDVCQAAGLDHVFLPVSGVDHGEPTWTGMVDGEAIYTHVHRFIAPRQNLLTRIRTRTEGPDMVLEWDRRVAGQVQVEGDSTPGFAQPTALTSSQTVTGTPMRLRLPMENLPPYLRLVFDASP